MASSIMDGLGLKPKIPGIKLPTARIPQRDTAASKAAARKKIEEKDKEREGRKSTIRGGGLYSGANLGGTS